MSREIELEGGKYRLIRDDYGAVRALRHGEEWRDLTGDKLVGALMSEVEFLRVAMQQPVEVGKPIGRVEYDELASTKTRVCWNQVTPPAGTQLFAGPFATLDFQKHLFNTLHAELTFQGDDSSRDVWEALGKALNTAPHEWDTDDHYGNEELGLWPPGAR